MTYDQAHFKNGERLSNFPELIQKSQDSKLGSLATSKTKLYYLQVVNWIRNSFCYETEQGLTLNSAT